MNITRIPSCIALGAFQRWSLLAMAALTSSTEAWCQCTTSWISGPGAPGTGGNAVLSQAWDPDGAGPLPQSVVIGGTFRVAGDQLANNIVRFTPATGAWNPMASGVPGPVTAIATSPVRGVAVSYRNTPTGPASTIAVWNGTTWTTLGVTNQAATDLAWAPNGDLFAVGPFNSVGGVVATNIARWNGSVWQGLGTGVGGWVATVTVLPNGNAMIGGTFSTVNGVTANNAAIWNGVAWAPASIGTNEVRDLLLLQNGNVLACGQGQPILVFNGVAWTVPVGAPGFGDAYRATQTPNGTIFVSGDMGFAPALTVPFVSGIGNVWTAIPTARVPSGLAGLVNNSVLAISPNFAGSGIILPDFGTVAAGNNVPAGDVAILNGTTWQAVGQGFNAEVRAIATLGNGTVVAGGHFTRSPGGAHRGIAQRVGGTWSGLGTGIDGSINAMVVLADGSLVAAGDFNSAGGAVARSVARWDGTSWTPMGTGVQRSVRGIAVAAGSNDPFIIGSRLVGTPTNPSWVSSIAQWGGTGWIELPTNNGTIGGSAIAVLPITFSGGSVVPTVVVGGDFTPASTGIAGLDGIAAYLGAWAPLGGGVGGNVTSLLAVGTDNLIASGAFPGLQRIARWNGTGWQGLGAGLAQGALSLARMPNGDIVAGGEFTAAGGQPANRLARWNGTSWSQVDGGADDVIYAVHPSAQGSLFAGGRFQTANGGRSVRFGELRGSCPATLTSYGSPCLNVSTGNQVTLTSSSLPWLGSSFRSTSVALPSAPLAVCAFGLSAPSVPLSLAFPEATPGCLILASFEVLMNPVLIGGQWVTDVTIPNLSSGIGLSWFHQIVQFVVSPTLEVSGSNGLQLSFGTF